VLRFTLGVLPWFLPGVILSMTVALIFCRPLGRMLGVRPRLAWAILVGFGVVVSATLTPLRGELDVEAVATGTCDLSRIGPAPIARLLRISEASLNIALVIPLGIAIALIQAPRPRAALTIAAIALPFGIEIVQLLAPILARGCQSSDVADNLTGLLIGLILGTGLRLVGNGIRERRAGDRRATGGSDADPST
jgi:hypothetical protein